MNNKLFTTLVDKKIIKFETKVWGIVTAKGLGGDPVKVNKELVITEINTNTGYIMGYNTRNPDVSYPLKHTDISRVDGMYIERLANAFDLNLDGTPATVGKKPGRKVKTTV